MSRQGFYVPGHCDLDLWPTDPKSTRIIYRPWPTKTPIMGSLSSIGFKLFSGQGFYVHRDLDSSMGHGLFMIQERQT